MRLPEEYQQFDYKVLTPELSSWSQQRAGTIQKVYLLLVQFACGVGIFGFLISYFISLWAAYAFLTAAYFLGAWLHIEMVMRWEGRFNERNIEKIIHFISPGMKIFPDRHFTVEDFQKCELFFEQPDVYSDENYVSGAVNGTLVIASEIKAQYLTHREGRNIAKTIFKGLIVEAELPEAPGGRTLILPMKAEDIANRQDLLNYLKASGRDAFSSGNPAFDWMFTVCGKNEDDASRILTSDLLVRMLEFREKCGRVVLVSLIERRAYVALAYTEDLWEPVDKKAKALFNPLRIKEYFENMRAAVEIIDLIRQELVQPVPEPKKEEVSPQVVSTDQVLKMLETKSGPVSRESLRVELGIRFGPGALFRNPVAGELFTFDEMVMFLDQKKKIRFSGDGMVLNRPGAPFAQTAAPEPVLAPVSEETPEKVFEDAHPSPSAPVPGATVHDSPKGVKHEPAAPAPGEKQETAASEPESAPEEESVPSFSAEDKLAALVAESARADQTPDPDHAQTPAVPPESERAEMSSPAEGPATVAPPEPEPEALAVPAAPAPTPANFAREAPAPEESDEVKSAHRVLDLLNASGKACPVDEFKQEVENAFGKGMVFQTAAGNQMWIDDLLVYFSESGKVTLADGKVVPRPV